MRRLPCGGTAYTSTWRLPHGKGVDRAEALCAMPAHWLGEQAWLVLYDAPSAKRKPQPGVVYGDVMTR